MLEPTIIQQIESDHSVNSKSDVIQRGNISQFNGIEAVLFSQSIFRTKKSDSPLFGHVVVKNGVDLQSRPVFRVRESSKMEAGRDFDTKLMSNRRSKNLAVV